MPEKTALMEKLNKFMETGQGKLVIVGGAVATLVFVVGLVMFLSKGAPASGGTPGADNQLTSVETSATPGVPVPASAKLSASKAQGESKSPADESFDVFQTRDPYKPLIEKKADTNGSLGGVVTTSTTSTVAKGPLTLDSVVTRDGLRYANVLYNEQKLELRDGQRVADSPYQVLTVSDANVIFLFGDDRVVLKPGEKIFK